MNKKTLLEKILKNHNEFHSKFNTAMSKINVLEKNVGNTMEKVADHDHQITHHER